MKAEALLALYERVADAPDAIARLRRFVLDLAVRGKLVEQLSEEGDLITIDLDVRAAPFDVPASWRWMRVGDQLDLFNGVAFKPSDWRDSGVKIVRIQNLNNPSAPFNHCDPEAARARSLIDDGSFLISWSGTPGTSFGAFIWKRGAAVLNQHIFRCDFKTNFYTPEFLKLAVNGRLDEMIAKAHGGVGLQHITKGKLEALLLPLPPFAEQHRIVAKVDELMALLDRLDAARSAREATRNRLTTASLTRLTAPDTDPEALRTHAHFALDALPALTTRVDQIKQLRQTIIDLAVRGKLSEQAAKASVLATEAESDASPAPGMPAGWRQYRLSALLAEDTRNGYSRRPDDAEDGVPILRISAGTVRKDGLVAEEEHKMISGIDTNTRGQYGLRPGDLLACRFNGNKAHFGRLSLFSNYLGLDPIYPDKLIRIRLNPALAIPAYVRLAGDSDLVRSRVELECATTVGNWGISASRLKEVYFPVPPLAEQHRIVAKVDELMALCDRLEAALQSADTSRARLLEALMHEALAAAMPTAEAA